MGLVPVMILGSDQSYHWILIGRTPNFQPRVPNGYWHVQSDTPFKERICTCTRDALDCKL